MKVLHVSVVNKIATYQKRDGNIVCGNSDYQVKFAFDSEWSAHNQKTARFIWNGQFEDVDFSGDTCDVPKIQNTDEVKVGVYAGDLQTTTSAVIGCRRSILCEGATPSVENDKYYANRARESADRAEAAAGNAAASAATAASEAAEAATAAAEAEVTRLVGELGVVQELGTSPTSVVSQAKVTKELGAANAKINRNSKRITNIEQGLTPDSFETDDSVAYQKDVPANALPYAAVQKVGGMTYKDGDTLRSAKVTEVKSVGANLLPEASIKQDNYWEVNADGFVYQSGFSGEAFLAEGKMALQPSTTYCISTNNTAYRFAVWFVDENNKALGRTDDWESGNLNFTTPATPCYGLFCALYNGVYQNDIMINKGAAHLPYVPNREPVTLPIPPEVRAKPWYGLGISKDVCNAIVWNEDGSVDGDIKCGEVDLGTLDWGIYAGYIHATLTKTPKQHAVGICAPYNVVTFNYSLISNGQMVIYDNGFSPYAKIILKDDSYTDAADFKAAMQGVMLVYELANPTTEDISDLITADNLIGVEGGGTLTFENEYGYAVPSEVEYQVEV